MRLPEGVTDIQQQTEAGREGNGRAGSMPNLPVVLPGRDVRRKRPPALSFLLRMETMRRIGRVASLLLIDYLAVFLAIYTALWLKYVLKGSTDANGAFHLS